MQILKFIILNIWTFRSNCQNSVHMMPNGYSVWNFQVGTNATSNWNFTKPLVHSKYFPLFFVIFYDWTWIHCIVFQMKFRQNLHFKLLYSFIVSQMYGAKIGGIIVVMATVLHLIFCIFQFHYWMRRTGGAQKTGTNLSRRKVQSLVLWLNFSAKVKLK